MVNLSVGLDLKPLDCFTFPEKQPLYYTKVSNITLMFKEHVLKLPKVTKLT